MSEERDEPRPPPPPMRPAADEEDRPANLVGGMFLIGCGGCLLFVGGLCASLGVAEIHSLDDLLGLVILMAIAAGGIFAIVKGVRMSRGRGGF
jgi:hypothetical protein